MTAINRARPVLVSAVAVPLAVAIAWTGYIASDDASYYFGALEWLTDPPFAGSDHWTTRFPLVLSLAAAIGLVGAGPLALGLTAVGWYLAFLLATALFAQRVGGPRVAILAALLIGTLPLVATSASIANCDLPEVAFLLLGLWLLAGEAAGERPRTGAALAAGISFGLAILCRETAVLALAGLGVPFLLGRPVTRRTLLLAAAGAACVLAGEMLFQWLVTGDPLHRYGLPSTMTTRWTAPPTWKAISLSTRRSIRCSFYSSIMNSQACSGSPRWRSRPGSIAAWTPRSAACCCCWWPGASFAPRGSNRWFRVRSAPGC